MKTFLAILACLLAIPAAAQTAPFSGLCENGGRNAITQGLNSSNSLLGIIPSCSVKVTLHGTTNPATIFADSISTPIGNPFTGNIAGSAAPGSWVFWAAIGVTYDVTMSGGILGPGCTTSPQCFTTPVTVTLQSGGGGGGGGLPTGQAATFPEYLAAGTTVIPIATTSIPETIRNLKIAGSAPNGFTDEMFQILLLGNSKVIGNNPEAVTGYCNTAAGIQRANDALFKQAQCRPSVSYACTANVCTVLLSDNSDGYVQLGDRISPTFVGAESSCLYGSYTVIAPTSGNSFTFDTTGSNSACGTVSSTSIPLIKWTKGMQLFGLNGATLEAWAASTGQWGGNAAISSAQSLIAKGITPVIWMSDSCIATNDFRRGGVPYLKQLATCDAYISKLQTTTATLPNGNTITLGQVPIYMDNGNPYANAGTAWATIQYVFPDGTSGSSLSTVPLVTACTQGGSTVTTIAAGTQAICNLSYIPDEIWSPGIAPPTETNFAGLLTRSNNPIQMIIDPSGSPETVTLQPFNATPGSASSLTGVAVGAASTAVTGYFQGQVSFTPANSHVVSGLQIVSTRQTADQAYSTWSSQLPNDEAKNWKNITPVDFQSLFYGKQSISSDNSVFGAGDEVHPTGGGYFLQEVVRQQVLAPYFNSPAAIIEKPPFQYSDDLVLVSPTAPPITAAWSEARAVKARENGSYIAPSGDSDWCLSSVVYTSVFIGVFNAAGAGFVRANAPNSTTQGNLTEAAATGDVLWTPQLHCWQPTTLAAPVNDGPNLVQFTTTGNPPVPYANLLDGSLFLIRRPLAVDAIAWNFVAHPETYKGPALNGTMVAGGTGTFTYSLNIAQPAGVPVGAAASQLTLQGTDTVVVQGNGGTVATGGAFYVLPSGGTSTPSGQNLVWNDPPGTSTTYVGTGQPIQIFESRLPDTVAQQSFSIQNQSATGYNTISTSTPSISIVTAGATVGGVCSVGTAYIYKIAYIPLGNPLADAGIASTASVSYTPVSGTTNTNSVRFTGGVPQAGFAYAVYGRTGGTFNYIGSSTAAQYNDTCVGTSNASFPASSVDLTATGNVPYDDGTAPSGAGLIPISVAAGSRKFHWGSASGASPLTTKGDLFGFNTANARIPIGADGTVLTADSTQALGVKWGTSGGGGTVTAVTGTSPVVSSGGTTPAISCPTCGVTGTGLNQFASTTSAQLAGVLSDETGTGVAVFSASPALTGTPTAPTATVGTNTTQLATTAFVLANAGAGAVSSVSNSDSTLTVSPTTGPVVASLNLAHANTFTATQSMPGLNLTGTTPGAASYVAGTGSIPTLTANSAGFAAPVTGGTAFLYKLPATAVAGILHAAAPGTVDGVNESAVTSSAVSLTADVGGVLPFVNGGLGTGSNFTAHQFFGNNTGSTSAPVPSLIGASDTSPNAYVAAAGAVNVLTVTLAPAATALVAGLEVDLLPNLANTTTTPTLNVNGLGAATITKLGTAALVAGDLSTTAVAKVIYDGTRWQLQNPQTTSGGGISGLTTNTVPTATSSTTIGNSTITNNATVSTVGAADTAAKTQVTIGNSSNTNGAILTILGNTSQSGNILCIGSGGCNMQMNAFGGVNIGGLTVTSILSSNTTAVGSVPSTTGSSCGTITGAGGTQAFQFTSSATGACSLVITPGFTASTGFFCSAKDLTTTADLFVQTASTTTTCTVTASAVVTSDKILVRVDTAF